MWHLRFATTRYRPDVRLHVATTWGLKVLDTTCHMSISLDGFVAGPDQSREEPLGKRGRELHGWHIGDPRANDADKVANEWLMRPRGAYVMGRNMFGPIRGDWDEDWSGWWGPEPPYHAPVFVLTHYRHDSPCEVQQPVLQASAARFNICWCTEGTTLGRPVQGQLWRTRSSTIGRRRGQGAPWHRGSGRDPSH